MQFQANAKSLVKIIVVLFILACGIAAAVKYLAAQEKNPQEVVIGFGGDTMLGRLVNETISQMQGEDRFRYPWGTVLPYLQNTDLNLVNLETTLTNSNKIVPKVFNYKASPEKVAILKEGNIEVVTLANNHIGDFSDEGLLETLDTLDKAGIQHVGAGANIGAAQKPVIITKNNIRIGIIGYTDNEPGWLATNEKPGTNYIRVGDIETITEQIKELRPNVDILIVTSHWGPNKRQRPTQEFINFAHAIIDAGADIIHGHSAHIFQGIELYKNKVIFYDTGDFVDDYAVDPILRNDRSFFYTVTIEKNGVKKIKLIPTLISNMQVNVATGTERDAILKRLQELSADFDTKISEDGTIIIH